MEYALLRKTKQMSNPATDGKLDIKDLTGGEHRGQGSFDEIMRG